jgi:uncharacterized protein (TIGR00369 family)
MGLEFVATGDGYIKGQVRLQPHHLAPNGYLHAATVVALADTACGYGCHASLPEDSSGFTTVELKSNFLGTAREGTITCEARRVHAGRTTQVWDAVVADEQGETIALFRCTQLVLRS